MAKSVIRLTPEEAKRRREQSYISATLSGMGRRQNNFLDTYGSDYLSQYRTQDELDRYYADVAARAEDARLLRYYTAAYGDEEGKKSLPDLDEAIRGYDRVLSGKQNAIDTFAMFNNAEEFNSVMQNLDYFNNYDIETNQEILDRMYKDREVYNAFSDAIGIMQPLTQPVYDDNGNEIYFSDYFSDYDSTADISTLEGSKAALDSVRRDKEIRALEGELSAARLAQSDRLDLLDDFSEYSVETDGAVRSLKSEKFDKEMSNEERARYFYLFNTEGEEAANQYAKDLQDNLRQRRLQNIYEWSGQWYTAPLASIASVGTQIAGAIDNTINLVDYFASAGLSDLQTTNAVQYTKAFRGGVTDSIDSAVGKFLYNIFMSGVDTYVASKLPGKVGSVLLGASVAASKLDSELERGASENEAIASGIAAGIFEMIFESISIGNLKGIQQWMENADPRTLKDYVLKIATSMGVNASEEAATEIANIIWDTTVMQSDDFVLPDAVLQTAEAALSGAVMGAGFAGLGFARGSYQKNKSYIKKMAEIGSEIRNTADADRILAEYVENAKKSGGKAAKAAEGYEKIEPRLDVKEKKKNVAAGKLVTEAAKAKFMSESRKKATENLEETHKKAEASASNAKTAVDLADAGRKSRPKIVSIEGSELSDIKVEIDGEQKTAADITFEEETNYPLLYAYAPMLGSVHAANEFIQRYGGQKDIHRYFDDFLYYQLMGEAAGAGKWESILKAKRPGVVLDVPDMYAAMQTGLEIRDAARKQKTEDAKKIAQEWKRLGGTEKSGKLDTTELRTYSMDEHQASVVDFARVLTEAFGFNITFYATKKGERSRGDGYFDAKTNTIHLDIEAGINEGSSYSAINSALLSTLSHEIVHSMAVNTPEQYGALRDFLVDWYAKRGEDFESKVLDLMDEQELEREDAIEELIALTCEDLLYSSDALTEAMKEFYKKDEKAAKTFLDKLKEILDKILAFFNFAQKNRSAEASALEEGGKKVIMEAQKRFDAALLAIREANMANNAITEMAGLDTEAVTVSEDGTIKLRQRQYRETGRETLSEYLTEQYGADMAESMIFTIDNIYDIVDQIQEENPDLQIFSRWQETETELDEEGKPIFTTNIQNGDYPLNQDFSRVCKKRRQLDAVLNWLAAKDDFDVAYLTKDDYRKINEAISSHGYEVACALCFVDAKRFRQSEWADSFAQTWNDILTSIVAPGTELTPFNFATDTPNMNDDGIEIDGSRSVTYRKWSQGKEDVKNRRSYKSFDYMLQKEGGKYVEGNTNVRHIAELIRDNPQLRHTFRGADIISSKGFDTIQRLAPSVRQILNGWGGTSAPKTSSLDAGYDNSILNISGYNKEAAFSVGGVRMNSFSDFIAHMFFDYAQAFADLYAKGLPMQAYSKELDFFRLFGKTGGKLNMSGIPAPRDGNKSTWNVEKRFAGLNVDKVSEALGKPINKLTVEDCLSNLDLCEYVWAKESIDIKKATLLQSGILYDKLSDAEIDRCYALIQEGKMDEALSAAGDNVDTAYAENIGIIVVGVSEPHIRKMLRDPTIRMVIPYHKSGLNPQIARSLGIYAFVDYTGIQSTRVQMKDGSIMNLSSAPDIKNAIGGDFKFYDYFGKTIDGVLYDGKRTAQKYLEWCEENSTDEYTIIPKFKDSKLGDFTTEENYYKLLEDFDCYNTLTGEHAPQNAVYFGDGALPDDYKDVLVRALKAEQKVSDNFRAELDGTSLREEILDIVRKRGYQGNKNRLRKQTPEANEVLQAIFEEDPDLVGYADHKRELKKYKKLMDDREVNLEKIADLDDQILALKSERKQSGKGTRMYELTSKRDILEKDVNEIQRRMFEMEAKELNKVIKRKTRLVAEKARKEANEKAREKSKERTENIAKRKYIDRIQERAKDMMGLLEKNSQKEHIPDAIKEPIADFLDSLNFASKRSSEGGAKTKKEIRLDEKMERVKEALEGKEFHSELNLPPEFMEEFDALVKTVRDIATHSTDMGGFTLEAMTSEELKDLNRMLIILKKSVNQMNALIVNARFANAKAAAEDSILAFGEQSKKGGIYGKRNAASDFLNYDNITPVFFFERMGEAAYSMFESIVDGQNMMAKLADQLLNDSKKMFSEKEVQAWRKDIRHLTIQGKDVYISIPQIMYLYALQKREQSYSHIHGAGIVVEDQDKSLIDQIKDKKKGPMKNTARGFNITEDEVDSIVSLLNDRQKEVADALQEYMSTVGSEWGNYVSMRRFGIHSFTERNYVPIYTVKATDSEQETKKSTTRMDLYSLLNMSFTHSLKKDANNRAVIKDLFDVFSDHMVDMATYRSFALPLLDILKWRDYEYNVDTPSVELPGGKKEVALKDYMTDAYGEAAWNYLTNLLKDLNGAQQTGRGEGLARKMISNYKVAAVAANLRVAMLQGTSYIRAANAMDVRDLSHVLSIINPKETKRGYLLALEWCGLVKWKDLGYFQVDISDPLAKKITGENSVRDTVVDWSMKLAEMGDQATIGNLWNALERETKRKRPDLAPGSKEFNEHVAKRLTEVILKTQVIDSVVTKSQVMRSKGGLVQVLSSFMSEPTLSYNNVVSNAQIALDAKKRGDAHAQKKALKGFCKSVSVFTIGAIMQAVVGSISDALRDDDEEKNLGEKYLKNLMYNALGELNPMGSIVFVKELEPILNNLINKIAGTEFPTFTSGRMDTAFVSSVITASNKIFKMFEKGVNSDSFMQSTYALLKAISQISGLPISNLIREVVSLWNSVVGLIDKNMIIEIQ